MNREILNVVIENNIDAESVKHIKATLSNLGEIVEFNEITPKGPQANLLLIGLSSVALIFSAAFFKKLGDKTAEDCYPFIKDALSELFIKYFGKNAKHKIKVVTSSEIKSPDTKYSLILAIYCVDKNNEQVKFLYETNWTKKQLDQATEFYLQAMIRFLGGGDSEVNNLIKLSSSRLKPYLIAWDANKNLLVEVNVMPSIVADKVKNDS